ELRADPPDIADIGPQGGNRAGSGRLAVADFAAEPGAPAFGIDGVDFGPARQRQIVVLVELVERLGVDKQANGSVEAGADAAAQALRPVKVIADTAKREIVMLGRDPGQPGPEVEGRTANREPVAGFAFSAPVGAVELAQPSECRTVDPQLILVIFGQQAAVEAGRRPEEGVGAGIPAGAFDLGRGPAKVGPRLLPATSDADHAAAEIIVGAGLDAAAVGPHILVDRNVAPEHVLSVGVAIMVGARIDLAPQAQRAGAGGQVTALQ